MTMRNGRERARGAVLGFGLLLVGLPAVAQLNPTAQINRYVEQLETYVQEKKHQPGEAAIERVVALSKEHDVTIPEGFYFLSAQVWSMAAKYEHAVEYLHRYLEIAGRSGDHYREALAMLLKAEEKLSDAQQRDDKAYERAARKDTSVAYGTYLREYRNGRHAAEARRRQEEAGRREAWARDDEAYEQARRRDTSVAYGTYLREYPNGRHIADARRRQEEARRLEAWARDDEAYENARREDTSAAYGAYLRGYRNGRHAVEARRRQGEAGRSRQAMVETREEQEPLSPGKRFRDCDECPELIVVPSGSYKMGSIASEDGRYATEGPRHVVTIGETFAVSVYEVTFAEWDACAEERGCERYRPDDSGWGRGRRPVINVSWQHAQSYVTWLSQKTNQEYRLLSEAEWEYVARSGTTTAYHVGPEIASFQANFGKNVGATRPVGSYRANRFGVHDIHGNVGEWVQDCVNHGYAGAPSDGRPWERVNCGRRVVRGGSWVSDPRALRSAFRGGFDSFNRSRYIGFRVARTL